MEKIKEIYGGRSPRLLGKEKRFAVLMPLVQVDGETYLVYEVRAAEMKTQPGEICFPGGRMDQGESVKDAALRENYEELGIPPHKVRPVGQGDYLRTHANILLYTYIGIIDKEDYDKRKLNPPEVDETFMVPLSWLKANEPSVYSTEVYPRIDEDFPYKKFGVPSNYPWRKGSYQIPLYEYPDGDIIRPIWGLTALLTMHFIETIEGK